MSWPLGAENIGKGRLNVLHVLASINPAGGGPVEAARLYSSARTDYDAEILTLDSDPSPWTRAWTVPVHSVGHSRIYSRYSAGAVEWLGANAGRFDAVVVHGVWGYHLVAVWRALRNTATPYFVILHGMLNPWFKRTYPLKHLKKTLAWRTVVGRTLRDSAGVLYLCPEERRLALSNFPIESPAEAFAGLGTPASFAAPDLFFERFPELRSRRILLFLGRICHMKGCDLLLRAFAGLSGNDSDAQLVMCGPDDENLRRKLERLSAALALKGRVTWTGPLYGPEKYSALSAADLLVLPSRCETFPVSVIEALGCGTPVLVTRDVNIHPQIESCGAGLVCRSEVKSIRDAIRSWFKKDTAARDLARQRARECHAAHFSLETAIREHTAALRANLAGKETEKTWQTSLSC